MDNKDIFKRIDHTVLKAVTEWKDIQKLCDEALKYNTASVCVPPSYIERIRIEYGDKINICTVIGFPLGYNTTEAKVFEAKQAIADGANELDMVVNLGDVKNGDFDKITEEIKQLKKIAGNKILKVIIETCYLTEENQALRLCNKSRGRLYKNIHRFGTLA